MEHFGLILLPVWCSPRLINILEYELKLENKDPLLVAFGKTKPQAKNPLMSSLTLFFCRVSIAEY
jgi:hypothetical protein